VKRSEPGWELDAPVLPSPLNHMLFPGLNAKDFLEVGAAGVGVEISLAGIDINGYKSFIRKSVDGDMAFGDHDESGITTGIFLVIAVKPNDVRRHDLGHIQNLRQIVQGRKDQIHRIERSSIGAVAVECDVAPEERGVWIVCLFYLQRLALT